MCFDPCPCCLCPLSVHRVHRKSFTSVCPLTHTSCQVWVALLLHTDFANAGFDKDELEELKFAMQGTSELVVVASPLLQHITHFCAMQLHCRALVHMAAMLCCVSQVHVGHVVSWSAGWPDSP
eukprot:GHRR01020221.1.p1 GENE.GHRR01020221.1~~GHRR01020221.1.p1  ORF type:complete len:123 (+),score=16.63 GHRR01020221.1:698-1066(+)